ncbi:hypothetical protein L195_g031051 [Trifolium pratense]|uniref:Uncharacterized protein n=1 Tax=Trifolium pratense TaxID=57577 RepID=A0A2K3L9A4_TRIPR|nr:hypothetical protein L195_g031051 [Trifolium pratense]
MADENHNHQVENQGENVQPRTPNGRHDDEIASFTESNDPDYESYILEAPLDIPSLAPGAPMETAMTMPVKVINHKGQLL